MPRYVRPIARHLIFPERYLLRDGDGRWYVWTGERMGGRPEEIEEATARWLRTRSWILPVPDGSAWVHVDDLPVAPVSHPSGWS